MRGLPAPVVRRAIERIVRDLTKQREHARREGTAAETEQGEEAAFSREALKKEESNVDVEAASATGTLVATTQRAGGTELGREKDGAAVPAFEDESGGADHAEVQEDIPQAADKSAAGTNREGVEVGGSEARCHDGASSPGTRSGIGLDKAKESLGAAPCLPLQLVTVELSKARAGLGLSEAWCKRVEEKCRDRQKQVSVPPSVVSVQPSRAIKSGGRPEMGRVASHVNRRDLTLWSVLQLLPCLKAEHVFLT